MSHLIFARSIASLNDHPTKPNFEFLFQRRPVGAKGGKSWGFPGGKLEGDEKTISKDFKRPVEERWRANLTGAVREGHEEMGGDLAAPSHACALLGGKEVRLPPLIALETTGRFKLGKQNTFFSVYLLSPKDGYFYSDKWAPQPLPAFKGEVDYKFGRNGYEWFALEEVERFMREEGHLCSWVGEFLRGYLPNRVLPYLISRDLELQMESLSVTKSMPLVSGGAGVSSSSGDSSPPAKDEESLIPDELRPAEATSPFGAPTAVSTASFCDSSSHPAKSAQHGAEDDASPQGSEQKATSTE